MPSPMPAKACSVVPPMSTAAAPAAASVSIRQYTSAYDSIHMCCGAPDEHCRGACIHCNSLLVQQYLLTSTNILQNIAPVLAVTCTALLPYVSIRQHTSAYVSIRSLQLHCLAPVLAVTCTALLPCRRLSAAMRCRSTNDLPVDVALSY